MVVVIFLAADFYNRCLDMEDFAGVGDFAGDCCGSDHDRGHEDGAAGDAALAALEVPVADELAQIWSPTSLSGFMARHIEQPAPRHSKPASREDLIEPFFPAHGIDNLRAGHGERLAPRRRLYSLRETRATSRKSERRPFVHEPRKATSIFVPLIGAPGASFM